MLIDRMLDLSSLEPTAILWCGLLLRQWLVNEDENNDDDDHAQQRGRKDRRSVPPHEEEGKRSEVTVPSRLKVLRSEIAQPARCSMLISLLPRALEGGKAVMLDVLAALALRCASVTAAPMTTQPLSTTTSSSASESSNVSTETSESMRSRDWSRRWITAARVHLPLLIEEGCYVDESPSGVVSACCLLALLLNPHLGQRSNDDNDEDHVDPALERLRGRQGRFRQEFTQWAVVFLRRAMATISRSSSSYHGFRWFCELVAELLNPRGASLEIGADIGDVDVLHEVCDFLVQGGDELCVQRVQDGVSALGNAMSALVHHQPRMGCSASRRLSERLFRAPASDSSARRQDDDSSSCFVFHRLVSKVTSAASFASLARAASLTLWSVAPPSRLDELLRAQVRKDSDGGGGGGGSSPSLTFVVQLWSLVGRFAYTDASCTWAATLLATLLELSREALVQSIAAAAATQRTLLCGNVASGKRDYTDGKSEPDANTISGSVDVVRGALAVLARHVESEQAAAYLAKTWVHLCEVDCGRAVLHSLGAETMQRCWCECIGSRVMHSAMSARWLLQAFCALELPQSRTTQNVSTLSEADREGGNDGVGCRDEALPTVLFRPSPTAEEQRQEQRHNRALVAAFATSSVRNTMIRASLLLDSPSQVSIACHAWLDFTALTHQAADRNVALLLLVAHQPLRDVALHFFETISRVGLAQKRARHHDRYNEDSSFDDAVDAVARFVGSQAAVLPQCSSHRMWATVSVRQGLQEVMRYAASPATVCSLTQATLNICSGEDKCRALLSTHSLIVEVASLRSVATTSESIALLASALNDLAGVHFPFDPPARVLPTTLTQTEGNHKSDSKEEEEIVGNDDDDEEVYDESCHLSISQQLVHVVLLIASKHYAALTPNAVLHVCRLVTTATSDSIGAFAFGIHSVVDTLLEMVPRCCCCGRCCVPGGCEASYESLDNTVDLLGTRICACRWLCAALHNLTERAENRSLFGDRGDGGFHAVPHALAHVVSSLTHFLARERLPVGEDLREALDAFHWWSAAVARMTLDANVCRCLLRDSGGDANSTQTFRAAFLRGVSLMTSYAPLSSVALCQCITSFATAAPDAFLVETQTVEDALVVLGGISSTVASDGAWFDAVYACTRDAHFFVPLTPRIREVLFRILSRSDDAPAPVAVSEKRPLTSAKVSDSCWRDAEAGGLRSKEWGCSPEATDPSSSSSSGLRSKGFTVLMHLLHRPEFAALLTETLEGTLCFVAVMRWIVSITMTSGRREMYSTMTAAAPSSARSEGGAGRQVAVTTVEEEAKERVAVEKVSDREFVEAMAVSTTRWMNFAAAFRSFAMYGELHPEAMLRTDGHYDAGKTQRFALLLVDLLSSVPLRHAAIIQFVAEGFGVLCQRHGRLVASLVDRRQLGDDDDDGLEATGCAGNTGFDGVKAPRRIAEVSEIRSMRRTNEDSLLTRDIETIISATPMTTRPIRVNHDDAEAHYFVQSVSRFVCGSIRTAKPLTAETAVAVGAFLSTVGALHASGALLSQQTRLVECWVRRWSLVVAGHSDATARWAQVVHGWAEHPHGVRLLATREVHDVFLLLSSPVSFFVGSEKNPAASTLRLEESSDSVMWKCAALIRLTSTEAHAIVFFSAELRDWLVNCALHLSMMPVETVVALAGTMSNLTQTTVGRSLFLKRQDVLRAVQQLTLHAAGNCLPVRRIASLLRHLTLAADILNHNTTQLCGLLRALLASVPESPSFVAAAQQQQRRQREVVEAGEVSNGARSTESDLRMTTNELAEDRASLIRAVFPSLEEVHDLIESVCAAYTNLVGGLSCGSALAADGVDADAIARTLPFVRQSATALSVAATALWGIPPRCFTNRCLVDVVFCLLDLAVHAPLSSRSETNSWSSSSVRSVSLLTRKLASIVAGRMDTRQCCIHALRNGTKESLPPDNESTTTSKEVLQGENPTRAPERLFGDPMEIDKVIHVKRALREIVRCLLAQPAELHNSESVEALKVALSMAQTYDADLIAETD